MNLKLRDDEDGSYYFEDPDTGEKVYFENPAEHHLHVYNLMNTLAREVEQLILINARYKERLLDHE